MQALDMKYGLDDEGLEKLLDHLRTNVVPAATAVQRRSFPVSLVGPKCPCRRASGGEQSTCLASAMKIVYEAFGLEKRMKAEHFPDDTKRGEWFYRNLWSSEMQTEFSHLEDAWKEACNSVEIDALVNLDPFKDAFKQVLLSQRHTSLGQFVQFCRDLRREGEDVVAGIVRYGRETILLLRIALQPACYALVDIHSRADKSETREPAVLFFPAAVSVVEYLLDLYEAYWKPHSTEGKEGKAPPFDSLILSQPPANAVSNAADSPPPEDKMPGHFEDDGHTDRGGSNLPPNSANPLIPPESNDTQESDTQSPPSNSVVNAPSSSEEPQESLSDNARSTRKGKKKEEIASPVRNRASRNRLQSEFGWQMSLQNQKIAMVIPIPVEETPEAPEEDSNKETTALKKNQETKKTELVPETDAKSSLDPDNGIPQAPVFPIEATHSNKSDSASISSKRARDLSKKDIGWQLALHVHDPSPSMSKEDQRDLALPKPLFFGLDNSSHGSTVSGSSDQTGKMEASKKSTNLLQVPSSSQSIRSDTHRQKAVRDEFSWQMNLAAKSLTFPISQLASKPPENGTTTSLSEWGVLHSSSASSPTMLAGAGPSNPTNLEGNASTKKSQDRNVKQGSEEFMCEHCFDNYPMDNLYHMDGCVHSLCRDCVRRHILSKLEGSVFPIFCPTCILIGAIGPGRVEISLIEAVNLPQKEIELFCRLALCATPTSVPCPKCRAGGMVTRSSNIAGHSQRKICPSCQFEFCKTCHKSMKLLKKHQCFKVNAVDSVVKSKNCRWCPGCQTSIQRPTRAWDFHVECPMPGCRYHFCYRCGDLIADGVVGIDIDSAVYNHYEGPCGIKSTCVIQ